MTTKSAPDVNTQLSALRQQLYDTAASAPEVIDVAQKLHAMTIDWGNSSGFFAAYDAAQEVVDGLKKLYHDEHNFSSEQFASIINVCAIMTGTKVDTSVIVESLDITFKKGLVLKMTNNVHGHTFGNKPFIVKDASNIIGIDESGLPPIGCHFETERESIAFPTVEEVLWLMARIYVNCQSTFDALAKLAQGG